MVEKLMLELSKLEEYTGVSIDKLYDVLEKQANVQLIYDILKIVGCVALICLGILATVYFVKRDDETNLGWHSITSIYEVLKEISLLATVGISAISLLGIPFWVGEIVQIISNKPIWMLEYLTKLIK